MEIYSQKDPRWSSKKMGASGYTMGEKGCLVTAVAQALTHAGHNVTPGVLADHLNNIPLDPRGNGGFTKDGLLIWSQVQWLYPVFTYGQPGYKFVRGSLKGSNFSHWVLETPGGEVFEPYHGKAGEAKFNREVPAVYRQASIKAAVAPAPAPKPTPAPKPKEVSHKVKSGETLTKICMDFYKLNAGNGYKKALEVAKYNGIKDANKISVGQVIKLPVA